MVMEHIQKRSPENGNCPFICSSIRPKVIGHIFIPDCPHTSLVNEAIPNERMEDWLKRAIAIRTFNADARSYDVLLGYSRPVACTNGALSPIGDSLQYFNMRRFQFRYRRNQQGLLVNQCAITRQYRFCERFPQQADLVIQIGPNSGLDNIE